MSIVYYVIDTETNGLNCKIHEVNEISIIRCTDRMQLTEFIKCEHPELSSFDALKITGKTLDDLKKGADKESVVEKANKFFEEDGLTPAHRCIVGHNIIPFDKKFLHALWEKCGKAFPANLWLDTITLTTLFLEKYDTSDIKLVKTATGRISKKLQDACDMVGVKKYAAAHASKVDAKNTYLLWRKLVDTYNIDYVDEIKTFVHEIAQDETDDDFFV